MKMVWALALVLLLVVSVFIVMPSATAARAPAPATPTTYAAMFYEIGLPAGLTWYANITGNSLWDNLSAASGASITALLPACSALPSGCYDFTSQVNSATFDHASYNGYFNVTADATTSKWVDFHTSTTNTFSLTESGLAGGRWWVNATSPDLTYNATVNESYTSDAATFSDLSRGTYYFTVSTNDMSYFFNTSTLSPALTHVLIAGSNAAYTGSFTYQYLYNVSIGPTVAFLTATGSLNYLWWANVTGPESIAVNLAETQAAGSVSVLLPNGTYDYVVATNLTGWVGSSGSFTLVGANAIHGTFTEYLSITSTSTSVWTTDDTYITVGIAAIAVVGLYALYAVYYGASSRHGLSRRSKGQ